MRTWRFLWALTPFFVLALAIGCASDPTAAPSADRQGTPSPPERGEEDEGFPVESELQAWFDRNGSGMLDDSELNALRRAIFTAPHEPREVTNPLDELLDENRDGVVEPREAMPVLHPLIAELLFNMHEIDPGFVEPFDANEDGRLQEGEVGLALDYLFFDPALREPHPIWHRADRFINTNDDDRVEENEIRQFLADITTRLVITPVEITAVVEQIRQMQAGSRPIESLLDELADINRDGEIGPREREQLELGVRGPHRVETPFDERLDFDNNGRVEEWEIAEAERAAEIAIHVPEALREEVRTVSDRLLDGDGDGVIDAREVELVVFNLLAFPHEATGHPFDRAADEDDDGFVSEEELLYVLDRYFRPHPVDPDLQSDVALDENGNGFIEPEEIGVAMGHEIGIPMAPIEDLAHAARFRAEMIARLRGEMPEREETAVSAAEAETTESTETTDTTETTARASQSDTEDDDTEVVQRRLGLIEDTEVAVVGIAAATEQVDEETISGLVVFVENAFVNVNRVTVVDRQNIEAIVSEYEFQVSDLTDRDTAVEIGKLSGADAIVVGSLSSVGSQYYLNIKLISVETGEILGSSIADAASEDEFFTMCNTAVYRLFHL